MGIGKKMADVLIFRNLMLPSKIAAFESELIKHFEFGGSSD
jgi:hypothetical protein